MALKTCQAGLVYVSDMAVTAFLDSGDLVDVMVSILGRRGDAKDLNDDCRNDNARRSMESRLNEALKGTKIKTHLGHSKKFKVLGPPANHRDSAFELKDGQFVTVAEYFLQQYGETLLYPYLPCVNVGSQKKAVLLPAEKCVVPTGQVRSKPDPATVAMLIKYAAVKPQERNDFIENGSLMPQLRMNAAASSFGVAKIAPEPLAPEAVLLPPAKLQYADGVVDPKLTGSWHSKKFAHAPPNSVDGGYPFGVLIVGDRRGGSYSNEVKAIIDGLTAEGKITGVALRHRGEPVSCAMSPDALNKAMADMLKYDQVHFIVVLMTIECYAQVKYSADTLGITTQCVRLNKVQKSIRGYWGNLMLKINVKLGGVNHTLASRLTERDLGEWRGMVERNEAVEAFQEPPVSLGWIFDKHCMVVGIDVSHPGMDILLLLLLLDIYRYIPIYIVDRLYILYIIL
jgi:eukaryotic translation initiation factor 2C